MEAVNAFNQEVGAGEQEGEREGGREAPSGAPCWSKGSRWPPSFAPTTRARLPALGRAGPVRRRQRPALGRARAVLGLDRLGPARVPRSGGSGLLSKMEASVRPAATVATAWSFPRATPQRGFPHGPGREVCVWRGADGIFGSPSLPPPPPLVSS